MVASTKLLHLLEAFSTPWFLFSSSTNHHLVFFLLEIFNNIIQYQFDGNSNLVYTIIRKRQVFHSLANLPSDYGTIAKSLNKRSRSRMSNSTSHENVAEIAMEGSHPALPAEPGTLKATLPDTPGIGQMTEKESAHPAFQQSDQLPLTNGMATINLNTPTSSKSGDEDTPKSDGEGKKLSRSPSEASNFSRQSVATVRIFLFLIVDFISATTLHVYSEILYG